MRVDTCIRHCFITGYAAAARVGMHDVVCFVHELNLPAMHRCRTTPMPMPDQDETDPYNQKHWCKRQTLAFD